MQRIITSLIFSTLSLSAMAGNCLGPAGSGETVAMGNANSALTDNTLCGSSPSNSDTWQEYHQSGGSLIEYAKGPSHPTDRSHPVGNWNATGGLITYTYSGGDSYTFEYWEKTLAGSVVESAICSNVDDSKVADIIVKNGQVACN